MNTVELTLVIVTAAVSAFNPYSIGLFTLFITYLFGSQKNPRYSLILAYVLSFLTTNLVFCYVFAYSLSRLSGSPYSLVAWIVALLTIIFGLTQIKQYFWVTHKFSLGFTNNFSKKISARLNSKNQLMGVFWIGFISAILTLPFTLVSFLAIASALHPQPPNSIQQLSLIYNLIYITPLLLIILILANKTKVSTMKAWLTSNKLIMRLTYAVLCISLAWILILSIKGTIVLG